MEFVDCFLHMHACLVSGSRETNRTQWAPWGNAWSRCAFSALTDGDVAVVVHDPINFSLPVELLFDPLATRCTQFAT